MISGETKIFWKNLQSIYGYLGRNRPESLWLEADEFDNNSRCSSFPTEKWTVL
jgi:hypothetical protein